MKVLTIIVTYNGMPWIDRCFQSLRESETPVDAFVVDNGSTDGTQEYLLAHYPEVVFVQNEKNTGFGLANNQGLRYALEHDYDYAYLLNEDAWIMPDTLSKLIAVHLSHPEFGVLSPAQIQADMQRLDHNFCVGPCNQNLQLQNDMGSNQFEDVYEVETIMAAHWLLPLSTIREVGLFSPTFPHYGEDDNYTSRVRFHGFACGVVMGAKAVHDRQYRMDSKEKLMYLHYICMLKLFSDPFLTLSRACYRCLGDTVKVVIRNHSIIPVCNVMRVVRNWYSIRNNRRISMNTKGAFVDV